MIKMFWQTFVPFCRFCFSFDEFKIKSTVFVTISWVLFHFQSILRKCSTFIHNRTRIITMPLTGGSDVEKRIYFVRQMPFGKWTFTASIFSVIPVRNYIPFFHCTLLSDVFRTLITMVVFSIASALEAGRTTVKDESRAIRNVNERNFASLMMTVRREKKPFRPEQR